MFFIFIDFELWKKVEEVLCKSEECFVKVFCMVLVLSLVLCGDDL